MGKSDPIKQRCGGGTFTKTTYSSGVNGMKDFFFDCGGYKDAAKFNETQKELSSYILRSPEKGGLDVAKAICNLKTEDTMPVAPTEDENKLLGLAKDVWMDNYRTQKRREASYLDGCKHAYAITLKLCTPCMTTMLEGTSGFNKAREDEDAVALITLIKGICCHFNDQQQPIWSIVQAKKRVFLLIQSEYLSIDKYYEEFKALVAVVETYGGTFADPGIIEKELANAGVTVKNDSNGTDRPLIESSNKAELDVVTKIAREKTLTLILLNGANFKRYTEVRNHLANQFTQGTDSYPKTIKGCICLLNNYKPLRPVKKITGHREEEEVASVQQGECDPKK